MQNGFIYSLSNIVIKSLYYLNLVEFFKFISKRLTPPNEDKKVLIQNCNIAIDVFIVLKWLLIIILWVNDVNNLISTLITFYLVLTNVYTYFYYHIWNVYEFGIESFTEDKIKRRFIAMVSAICFSNLCFAYLYSVRYHSNYLWSVGYDSKLNALLYSVANSLTVNIEGVKPCNIIGNELLIFQIFISFTFLTIILTKSIPQENNN